MQQPGERHLGERLPALLGDLVQGHDLAVDARHVVGVQEARIVRHARIRGDAVEIPVGQQTLRERAERDETLAQVLGGGLEPVALDGAVEDVVFVLVDDERHVQFIEDRRRPLQLWPVVVRQAHIERLAAGDGLGERAHRFLQRGLGVRTVMVEDVDVVESQAFQALVE